jgi:threonyl-tRNA synthetase
VRRALTAKTPAVLVVGDDDLEHNTVGLRLRDDEDEQRGVPVPEAGRRLVDLCAPPR